VASEAGEDEGEAAEAAIEAGTDDAPSSDGDMPVSMRRSRKYKGGRA